MTAQVSLKEGGEGATEWLGIHYTKCFARIKIAQISGYVDAYVDQCWPTCWTQDRGPAPWGCLQLWRLQSRVSAGHLAQRAVGRTGSAATKLDGPGRLGETTPERVEAKMAKPLTH